jgi:hypothetical protein
MNECLQMVEVKMGERSDRFRFDGYLIFNGGEGMGNEIILRVRNSNMTLDHQSIIGNLSFEVKKGEALSIRECGGQGVCGGPE